MNKDNGNTGSCCEIPSGVAATRSLDAFIALRSPRRGHHPTARRCLPLLVSLVMRLPPIISQQPQVNKIVV